jgi:hypothetical protein
VKQPRSTQRYAVKERDGERVLVQRMLVACSPESDPGVMRVQPPRDGAGRILDEA